VKLTGVAFDLGGTLLREDLPQPAPLIYGAKNAVRAVRKLGLKAALITNADSELVEIILRERGLFELLDPIVTAASAGSKKPDPAIFAHVVSIWSCDPEACVMIGDHPAIDLNGARTIGMRTIHFARKRAPSSGCDAVASDFRTVLRLLRSWCA
jgi:FMN phosphatase YigB (HAD superfamily)